MSKKEYHVLALSNKDKERLIKISNEAINIIQKTKNIQEQAFILRMLMESFEENNKCTVPFNNRYTSPDYIYHENGANE